MWQHFDLAEIRDDFAHISALGLDTVRFFLRWDAFAPQADRLEPLAFDQLETIVTTAGDCGLRAMPVLCCGHMHGVNWLPDWALDRNAPRGRFRTFSDERESPLGCADLYRGPLLAAQLLFARAAARRLSAHPALFAWDIGHAFSNVREPSHAMVTAGEHSKAPADEAVLAAWSRRLAEALHETSPAPVTAGTFSGDLTMDRSIRFSSLCSAFRFASMQGSNICAPFARSRLDPEVVPFFAMLTAGFSLRPVLVTGFGNPTCPAGKFSAAERFALAGDPPQLTISPDDPVFATFPCLTEDETAFSCTNILERLHADGRLGAYWWCWADYSDDVRASPPFAGAPYECTYGIVRADGSEKPVAQALAAFARQEHEVLPARDMPMIASAYYYRTLPTSMRTLFEAFLRFVGERRSNAERR